MRSQPAITVGNSEFPCVPSSWYCIGRAPKFETGPVRFALPDKLYVGYRTQKGRAVVLSGRCSHLGADLSGGTLSGDNLRCPLHGWEYDPEGICTRIPATSDIPGFARQTSYPAEEKAGYLFFFNRSQPRFPLPFFDGVAPAELLAASAFEFIVDAPWYMLSGNGFDVQHFRCAHDRILVDEPAIDSPHPLAWRLRADFQVVGNSILDRLTRLFSGTRVTMTVTNWSGNLVLVSAQFPRTTSYGIVSFIPLTENKTLVRDIVLVPRSRTALGRLLVDPLDVWLRRYFIREFVRSDANRSHGIHLDPHRLIAADKVLADFFNWLKNIPS